MQNARRGGRVRCAAGLGLVAAGLALAGCPSPAAPPRGAAGAVPAASEPDTAAAATEPVPPPAAEPPAAAPAPAPAAAEPAAPAPEAAPVTPPKPIRSTPTNSVNERPAGDFTHAGTGLVFSPSLAGFRRVSVRRYDAEGNDYGVGYSRMWKTFHGEVTAYAFPADADATGAFVPLDEEFEGETREVTEAWRNSSVVATEDREAEWHGRRLRGRAREFEADGGPGHGDRRVRTFLVTYDAAPWRLKIRFTVPAVGRDEALPEVAELLRGLGFPPLGFAPASEAR